MDPEPCNNMKKSEILGETSKGMWGRVAFEVQGKPENSGVLEEKKV